jgi:carbamoyl-phosphate synthase small subunit
VTERALLVLADGTVFEGESIGAPVRGVGEIVFNTSMTGYQEILTDPSYAGQIVVMTYPLIGNYGTSDVDVESRRVQAAGLVVREVCDQPSHWLESASLRSYLRANNVPAISGLDTRALTRRIRSGGVLQGTITSDEASEAALARIQEAPTYEEVDFVQQVSTPITYGWDAIGDEPRGHIVVVDMGVKFNIMRTLNRKGYRTTAVSCDTNAEDILALAPDGVVLSPGPGDPAHLDTVVRTATALLGKQPVMGICLGHQVLARAFGGRTYKLKFGHHGGNHPVKDLLTGDVHVTSQNHGYAVDADSLRNGVEMSHLNLNDATCEGLHHPSLPIVSIQYHSEAAPGPHDNMYLFDRFLQMVQAEKRGGS